MLLAVLAGCGGEPPRQPAGPSPSLDQRRVEAVIDGDTIRVSPAFASATSVRLLGIDAPEKGGDTQEPWASEATAELQALLLVGSSVGLETDVNVRDTFGRLLAHVRRASDGLDLNREQLRRGRAVLYVIWPNLARFGEYRAAQVSAQQAGVGLWRPDRRLAELPFQYRRRKEGEALSRPAGDWFTGYYVAAIDVGAVSVNNRLFFSSAAEAESAGFRPCPRDASGYAALCFGPAS